MNSELVSRGEEHLEREDVTPADLVGLATDLEKDRQLSLARRLVAKARKIAGPDSELARTLAQKYVLFTYKDPDLPAVKKLRIARETLESELDLASTQDPETLGLAGAVFKRYWELDGNVLHLERSLAYYRRGHDLGPETKLGYLSINTAFVLDLLADIAERAVKGTGVDASGAKERREEARRIRAQLLSVLEGLAAKDEFLKSDWWFLVTVAECHFGLRQYEESTTWLEAARKGAEEKGIPIWQREATARQLATLVRLQEDSPENPEQLSRSPAWRALESLFTGEPKEDAVRSILIGKVGLALSGGGFRASLFHIGVLARLADMDLLRYVEAISCVSGGSIIGAKYYLELRREFHESESLERGDYVSVVREVQKEFLAGVQKNLRTRVVLNPFKTIWMMLSRNYSRTKRLAELMEGNLFRKAEKEVGADRSDETLWLTELYIKPGGKPFTPKHENWKVGSKVPMLILNATPLNTGHNWQFTASWMGEPPVDLDETIDNKYRLRRLYYPDMPVEPKKVRLGDAVAASACVPGLFEPVPLYRIYEDGITIRLVDGGVHDNQGTSSLLEQGCNVLIVSDASGQMDAQNDPDIGILRVPLRSNSILMDRVRQAQYQDLAARERASLLRGMVFLHLKKDLPREEKDWRHCKRKTEFAAERREKVEEAADYHIDKDIQAALAGLRTDLDSFSDAEAFALMTSGYRMTEHDLSRKPCGLPVKDVPDGDWDFLAIEPAMRKSEDADGHARLLEILEAGRECGFKIWKLHPVMRAVSRAGKVLVPIVLIAICILCYFYEERTLWELRAGLIGSLLVTLIVGVVAGSRLLRLVEYRKTIAQVGMLAGLAAFGWLAALVHLTFFDRLFLRHGRVERVLERERKDVDRGSREATQGRSASLYQ